MKRGGCRRQAFEYHVPIPKVASESGREIKDVEDEVKELLEEIGHKMMLPAVRSLAVPIRMTVRNVLRGVYVNTEGVERVRRIKNKGTFSNAKLARKSPNHDFLK